MESAARCARRSGDAAVFYGDAVVVGDAVVCGAAAADRTADAAAADLNGIVRDVARALQVAAYQFAVYLPALHHADAVMGGAVAVPGTNGVAAVDVARDNRPGSHHDAVVIQGCRRVGAGRVASGDALHCCIAQIDGIVAGRDLHCVALHGGRNDVFMRAACDDNGIIIGNGDLMLAVGIAADNLGDCPAGYADSVAGDIDHSAAGSPAAIDFFYCSLPDDDLVAVAADIESMERSGSDQDRWLGLSQTQKDQEIKKMLEKPCQEIKVTQELRQEEYDNYKTTDDHGMLIYGIAKDQTGKKFYMVKNSWGTDSKYKGTWYASETFVAFKTMNIVVHKNAIPKEIRAKLGI